MDKRKVTRGELEAALFGGAPVPLPLPQPSDSSVIDEALSWYENHLMAIYQHVAQKNARLPSGRPVPPGAHKQCGDKLAQVRGVIRRRKESKVWEEHHGQ